MAATVYRCNLCVGFVAVSLRLLLNHLSNHRNDPDFHVLCGIDGCARSYKVFYSFRNHITKKHRAALMQCEDTVVDENVNFNQCSGGIQNSCCEITEFGPAQQQEQLQKTSALCVLRLKEKGRVPQTVVDLFVQNCTEIVKNATDVLQTGVKNQLNASGLDFEAIPGLKDLFGENSSASNPFHGLENERQQHKYYLQNLGLVEPREVVMATYHKKVRRGNKWVDRTKKDVAYYIPLLESLQQLLNEESVLDEVLHLHARDDDKLSDFCDGAHYKLHPLFKNNPTALQILLYYDELEVCNPLGSRTSIHKLGAFYYTLGNIKPENRSHANAIQLLGLVNNKDVKKYGIEPLMEKFLEDLHQLEQDDGYEFVVGKERRKLRGSIAYCSGDNLGSQLLGGFKEGSRSHRPCRECMGTAQEIKLQFHEKDFVLRTKENHIIQCQRLPLGDHYSKTYGLNRDSCLNQSRFFHVVGGLPADAMHDILEGVLQYEVKEVLKIFIFTKKLFTLDELNNRMRLFDFGYHNDPNKPSPILKTKLQSKDNGLRQHANQMWCLAVYLPMLIGVCIPEDDQHWKLFCTLLGIVRIIFSPLISEDQTAYLQLMIHAHHEKFQQLYPECSIIPKMHYMIHMPRIILELGPLVRSWCMRYEAKHSYFKRLASIIGNFTNLPYTLAKRHQEGLCYRLRNFGGEMRSFIEKGFETGPGKMTYVGVAKCNNLLLAEQPGLDHLTPVFSAKWVSINGTKYRVGATIHIGYSSDELPQFWEIVHIYIVNKDIRNIKFIVSDMITTELNEHFQSYQVIPAERPQIEIAYHKNFTYYVPLTPTKPCGMQGIDKFVSLRVEMVA